MTTSPVKRSLNWKAFSFVSSDTIPEFALITNTAVHKFYGGCPETRRRFGATASSVPPRLAVEVGESTEWLERILERIGVHRERRLASSACDRC
jgi:hypothetical protein